METTDGRLAERLLANACADPDLTTEVVLAAADGADTPRDAERVMGMVPGTRARGLSAERRPHTKARAISKGEDGGEAGVWRCGAARPAAELCAAAIRRRRLRSLQSPCALPDLSSLGPQPMCEQGPI